jgi:hypothetical protein
MKRKTKRKAEQQLYLVVCYFIDEVILQRYVFTNSKFFHFLAEIFLQISAIKFNDSYFHQVTTATASFSCVDGCGTLRLDYFTYACKLLRVRLFIMEFTILPG